MASQSLAVLLTQPIWPCGCSPAHIPDLRPTFPLLLLLLLPLPHAGLVGLAGVLVNWLYSVFFIVAELWGAVAISMLFWWVGRNRGGVRAG